MRLPSIAAPRTPFHRAITPHRRLALRSVPLDDIKALDLWPTTYVSDLMDELPPHWHAVDNCGYLLEGIGYILDEKGERVPLGPGDKLIIPRGAVHAEGAVTERTVYIVGLPWPTNMMDELIKFEDPETSPLKSDD